MKILKTVVLSLIMMLNSYCSAKAPLSVRPDSSIKNKVKKTELKIMSYNVRHCSPPAHPEQINVEAIADIIRHSGAEVIGLQEIDVHNGRSGIDLDQATKLGELTGMYSYFSKGIDYDGGAYGTAILSKYPLSNQKTIQLPKAEGTEQRTLSLVTITLPEGKMIRFANTHLDYSSDAHALAQAQVIVETLKDEKVPVFITGDFNTEPESETFRYLNQSFNSTCGGVCLPTFPADFPKKAIDFIFYSTVEKTEVRMHEVLNEASASDHRPIIAKLAW